MIAAKSRPVLQSGDFFSLPSRRNRCHVHNESHRGHVKSWAAAIFQFVEKLFPRVSNTTKLQKGKPNGLAMEQRASILGKHLGSPFDEETPDPQRQLQSTSQSQDPPFSRETHLCSPEPDEKALLEIFELRELLRQKEDLFDEEWATDEQLHRCLIAKQFNKEVALNLAKEALKWRKKRAPHLIEKTDGWQNIFDKEAETGKIYSPGLDKWQRPVVVFDNGAANTSDIDNQMLFLGWVLNFACREMPKNIDKYNIFMHLESFSFFNIPPLSATTETIHMLCNSYPERLGMFRHYF